MSNILRIVSFVFIVAFLACESKAALFFHHVNPTKQQNGAFAKIKNYLYQPNADMKSCKEGLIPWKTICLPFWFR
eukprot:06585.XXX_228711_228999_1 [CDS] Oithona nana genome sequencing.